MLEDSLVEDTNWLGGRMAPVQALGLGNSVLGNTFAVAPRQTFDGGNRGMGFQI